MKIYRSRKSIIKGNGDEYTPCKGKNTGLYRLKQSRSRTYTYKELTEDGDFTMKSNFPKFLKRISDGKILYRGEDDRYTFGNIGGKRFSYQYIMRTKLFHSL